MPTFGGPARGEIFSEESKIGESCRYLLDIFRKE